MDEDFFQFDDLIQNLTAPTYIDVCDWTKKDVGDRVSIIDYCSLSNIFENKPIDDGEVDAVPFFIIIDINLKHKYTLNNITYIQDIIIANPRTKKCYRIASQHTKLFN